MVKGNQIMPDNLSVSPDIDALYLDIKQLIQSARIKVTSQVNQESKYLRQSRRLEV